MLPSCYYATLIKLDRAAHLLIPKVAHQVLQGKGMSYPKGSREGYRKPASGGRKDDGAALDSRIIGQMMTELATLVLQHGTIQHHKVRPEPINKKRVFILAIGELKIYPFPFPSTITKQGLSTAIIICDHQDAERPSQLIPEIGTFPA
jgi:hypothetical protein